MPSAIVRPMSSGLRAKTVAALPGSNCLQTAIWPAAKDSRSCSATGAGDYDKVAAVNGENITLTIDEAIQAATESALKDGVEKAEAEAGIAIVMRPSTGEILALANVPDFDPNHF